MSDAGKPVGRRAGIDVGGTLLKLAFRDGQGALCTETHPAIGSPALTARLAQPGIEQVGLCGAGAARLAERLSDSARVYGESEAWAAGARGLAIGVEPGLERFLLVSVGTGTSAMLVEPAGVARVGGTALGGGTIVGLARGLTGADDFEALVRLAQAGDRSRVDLSIGDIYAGGTLPLPAQATASNFGKLARDDDASGARAEDLASALIGMVAENVGLVCAGLARQHGVASILFGGSTLPGCPELSGILRLVCLALGATPHFPAEGPYVGALGALALADAEGDGAAGSRD